MKSKRTIKAKDRMLQVLHIMADGGVYTNAQLADLTHTTRRLILSSTSALAKLGQIQIVGKTFGKKSPFTQPLVGGLGRENINLYQITTVGVRILADVET